VVMLKPTFHVFVCSNQRPEGHPKGSCSQSGAINIWQKFADVLNQRQMYDKVVVSGVRSCLAPCQFGPVVLVYPEGIWYGRVQEGDVDEIFEQHFTNGKPVERLMIPEELFGM